MKIKYQDSLVAFVDVLGFSRLVYASDNTHIEAYFNYVVDDLKGHFAGTSFEYLLISDSIVVSAANSLANLKILVKLLSKIQAKLLSRGILMRGAIANGDLYVNRIGNVVVGPGLIRAYEMENSAIYPRIIIDRNFISLYYGSTKRMIDDFSNWLTTDEIEKYADGAIYVNYPRYVANNNASYGDNRMENILALLKEHYYSNEHYAKYDWLLVHLIYQFNLSVKESAEEGSPSRNRKTRTRRILKVLPRFLEM
jgi:hypothetical protein